MPGGGGRRGWSRGSGAGDSGDRIKRSARKRKSRKYPRKAQPDVVAHTTQEAETGGLTERGGGRQPTGFIANVSYKEQSKTKGWRAQGVSPPTTGQYRHLCLSGISRV